MLIILPFLALILIYANLYSFSLTRANLFREKILISLISWALIFELITEVLSFFNLVTSTNIMIVWFLILFILVFLTFKNAPQFVPNIKQLKRQDVLSKFCFFWISLVFFITFILAVSSAPNNMGAMTYHLARIPHWIQNQNVNYYATNISWQISISPFASYPQLHFYLLSNTDRFANLVQWIFASGALIGVSLLAKRFGANLKEQILAAFIMATIPMGILQASTVHDPYIVAFFLICFVYFGLLFYSSPKIVSLLIAGAGLGLALFTKQTAYVFAFPFFLWIIWLWIKKFGFKQSLYYAFVLSLVVLLINSPFYVRNLMFLGWPIFSIRNDYLNDPVGIVSLVSGIIKNLALHLSTPLPALNSRVHEILSFIFKALNIPENSQNLNWTNQPFGIPQALASEYTAPNPIHLILFIASSWLVFLKKHKNDLNGGFILCIILGFVLFSGIFRWQEAGSHLQFPLFVLSAPVISRGVMMLKSTLRYILMLILTLASIYYLFFNLYKPIISKRPIFVIPRLEQYFMFRPKLYVAYKKIAQFTENGKYKNVGVVFEENYSDFEYPLWIMLNKNKDITFEHIGVGNPTRGFSGKFKPDVIIFLSGNKKILEKYINEGTPIIGAVRNQ